MAEYKTVITRFNILCGSKFTEAWEGARRMVGIQSFNILCGSKFTEAVARKVLEAQVIVSISSADRNLLKHVQKVSPYPNSLVSISSADRNLLKLMSYGQKPMIIRVSISSADRNLLKQNG